MQTLVQYAMSFVGQPYRWGGDDPIEGWDCSGMVQEILASYGIDPTGDQTADALYRFFKTRGASDKRPGSLAFFGSEARVTHVGFMIDSWRMIEAGGGGSKTRSVKDAAQQNAYVRIRPIESRGDLFRVIHPIYLA